MNLLWIIVILLVLFSVAGSPSIGRWNYGYGWGPSGIGTVIAIILVVMLLTGRL